MLLGRVVGEVWGARQAPRLAGHKLLLVQPLAARAMTGAPGSTAAIGASGERQPTGRIGLDALAPAATARVVAVDGLGAGVGEFVLVAHGTRCRDLTCGPTVPTKDVVIAIVDGADLDLCRSDVATEPRQGGQP